MFASTARIDEIQSDGRRKGTDPLIAQITVQPAIG